MILKLDLKKAYDRLEWSFIKETLSDGGLPRQIVNTVMKCVSSGNFKLLWNGKATNTISPMIRVRQGNPNSPYLFILCLERLTHRIQAEFVKRRSKPIEASRGRPYISHLFFVDDLLLLVEESLDQVEVIK